MPSLVFLKQLDIIANEREQNVLYMWHQAHYMLIKLIRNPRDDPSNPADLTNEFPQI